MLRELRSREATDRTRRSSLSNSSKVGGRGESDRLGVAG